ncbi:glycerophosphoryl diester phosphodiesterase [Nannocystis exedens]|uniref:Glycerophosphoryl diester phosphodiesterase n=1 Tax=Nannocystis exedens TaxID=54 RepID=A0A1I2BUC1_9BACT|nr:glycerophosphodiester phosphodiesterase [Nannocystis exedens]PCC71253.1 glycerophosphoryl diester phosphodiesterase [Nannocystis exedens]SFE59671.1 glycerophosphoryl diester phosphodiesterase [Nannocystis exedens]
MLREIGAALLLSCSACGSPGMSGETGDASGSTTTSTGSTTTGGTSEAPTTSSSTTEAGSETGQPPGNLLLSDKFLNIAHRGGGLLRPEETLPAFEHALAVGADVLEFDVHASSDGVLVAMHDATVDRTTDGTGAIKAQTLDELRALDAGYRFTPDGGQTFPYRGMGLQIPTLDEILEQFPDSYYLIEIKQTDPPIVDGLLAALEQHAALERVVVASGDLETIMAVRAAAPEVFTSLSTPEVLDLYLKVGSPEYVAPARFVHSPWDLTSAELVTFAHELGLKVHPWTVNEEDRMVDLIGRGVDGIMTDDPALLATVAP